MKSQAINSYQCFDINPGMFNSFKEELARRGISLPLKKTAPMPPISAGARVSSRPKERNLTMDEFLNLFDKEESLCMAYVPHLMTQCVLYYADLLMAYTTENKLSDFKRHKREIKKVSDEYIDSLRKEMSPRIFQLFLDQRKDYIDSCGSNLAIMFYTFNNELMRKYGGIKHNDAYCYAYIISSLIKFVEDFDNMVNRKIEKKLDMPCRNNGDARLTYLRRICDDIISPYPVGKTQQTETAVKVIFNKAIEMVKAMLEE